jgi:hypothetical protein
MKLFNTLKGLFSKKDRQRRKGIINLNKVDNKTKKEIIKEVNGRFRDNNNLSEQTRRNINKRRKKAKLAKKNKKRGKKK